MHFEVVFAFLCDLFYFVFSLFFLFFYFCIPFVLQFFFGHEAFILSLFPFLFVSFDADQKVLVGSPGNLDLLVEHEAAGAIVD